MGFTELSHAFIAAKYYVYLKEIFGDRGEAAFLHATRYYGEQRGRRMAQRAIRDGKPLTYETYCQYGEWVNTEEVKAQGLGNQSETTSLSPDFQIHIHVCPWHTQFKNMGLPEAGLLYCKDLDASISRGFNPEIRYEVSQTLHDHDYCIQTIRNAGLTPESNMAKNPAGLRSFEYHCAHSYWAYREVCEAIFGEEGTRLAERVLDDFAAEYGKKMVDTLAGYARTNFNIAD